MNHYADLKNQLLELRNISSAVALLIWDQEVKMPKGGASQRAKQVASLSGMHHSKSIEMLGTLLPKVEQEEWDQLSDWDHRNLKQLRKDYDKIKKLPNEYIKAVSQASSEAQHVWIEARKKSDFSLYQEKLQQMIDLKIKQTEYMGYEDNPYDVLLDDYEPEMKASAVQKVFEDFKPELLKVLSAIREAPQVDESFIKQEIDEDSQWKFGEEVLSRMGFDFNHGRQDRSVHPFTLTIHPEDVRITTRLDKNDIREMLYSSVHEGGHGIYEQGLPMAHLGMPACEECSLSIHESQSRLWENNVARSLEFWEYYFPQFAKLFPDSLKGKGPEDVFAAVNLVQSSPIRISGDELTYHFHIMLRFELELALINREIKVADLPALWNKKMKDYLGIDVKNDAEGVLQDIHWAHGNIGYFPTYSLGSFYAAQFMQQARKEMPLDEQFRNGEFSPLKSWLNENIHSKGKLWSAEELCEQITGETLNVKHFVNYAKDKYSRIYPSANLT